MTYTIIINTHFLLLWEILFVAILPCHSFDSSYFHSLLYWRTYLSLPVCFVLVYFSFTQQARSERLCRSYSFVQHSLIPGDFHYFSFQMVMRASENETCVAVFAWHLCVRSSYTLLIKRLFVFFVYVHSRIVLFIFSIEII